MQRLHGLFNRHILVKPVDLQEVDVLEIQTLERCVDGVENSLARKTDVVRVVLQLR